MVRFESVLVDRKARGINVGAVMTLREYWDLANYILDANPFQRRRVRAKFKVYALLQRDLLEGCVIPPISLATSEKFSRSIADEVESLLTGNLSQEEKMKIGHELATRAIESRELLVLDGLQRTHAIEDAMTQDTIDETRARLENRLLRIEIYIGMKKQGILYRMLTLNTGQTPMSFRHQLEILYYDYLDDSLLPEGVSIVKEVESKRARSIGTYRYSDIIDLYQSFIQSTSKPVDRESLFEEIKKMDFLEKYEIRGQEEMMLLLEIYNDFMNKLDNASPDWSYRVGLERFEDSESEDEEPFDDSEEFFQLVERPFGTSINMIFSKSQPMTGFGCACSFFIENGIYKNLQSIRNEISTQFQLNSDQVDLGMKNLIQFLDDIRRTAKRYGDAQRGFFEFYFRVLLDKDDSNRFNLVESPSEAFDRYRRKYS